MSWLSLIAVLLSVFQVVMPFLKDLFANLDVSLDAKGQPPADARTAVAQAFDAARGRTWVWQLGRRAALAAAKRVALRKANEIVRSAKDGVPAPTLTADEQAEILDG